MFDIIHGEKTAGPLNLLKDVTDWPDETQTQRCDFCGHEFTFAEIKMIEQGVGEIHGLKPNFGWEVGYARICSNCVRRYGVDGYTATKQDVVFEVNVPGEGPRVVEASNAEQARLRTGHEEADVVRLSFQIPLETKIASPKWPENDVCSSCVGSGKCPHCGGSGCEKCDGGTCPTCNGDGRGTDAEGNRRKAKFASDGLPIKTATNWTLEGQPIENGFDILSTTEEEAEEQIPFFDPLAFRAARKLIVSRLNRKPKTASSDDQVDPVAQRSVYHLQTEASVEDSFLPNGT